MSTFLETRITKPQALSYYANQIKRLGQQAGAVVQIAQAQVGQRVFFIAGINSSARWTPEQLALLAAWGVEVAPCLLQGEMGRADGGAPHAEENIAACIHAQGGRALRWSRAVVGAHFDTRSGTRSYVCQACRAMVQRVGGQIEPPF
jgi:hypothetical protein